mmetsp:Transcript_374/g.623  ORF Transcript_374/g.623 Transcript_374/m.623 type:complete len:348 (-) Transcript_374:61-1104(-)
MHSGMIFDERDHRYILSYDDFQQQSSAGGDDRTTKKSNVSATTWHDRFRERCGQIINNEMTQKIIVAVIIFNSVLLGFEAFDFVGRNPNIQYAFDIIDYFCLILFTLEILMQFIYRRWEMCKDPWLTFDSAIIMVSWMGLSVEGGKAFRIIRALRIVMRMHDMKELVEALITCIPSIFAVGMLLMLILYIYGVMFTLLFQNLYQDGYLDEDYFSRLDYTLLTLIQMMTMDNWSAIIKQVMVVYPWAWFPFILYILMTTFIVLNLAVGVISSAVANVSHDEIESHLKQVSSDFEEKNDLTIRVLERKIDELTFMIEKLVRDHDERRRTEIPERNLLTPHSFINDRDED